MGMYDNLYDINAGAAGQASQASPEEKQMQRLQRMITAAEYTNYDGDPDYYNQIKSIAMQAGIPIKKFKTNPFRAAGILGASFLDTSVGGLMPNSMYTPEGGHVSGMDSAADMIGMGLGMVNPIGLPARLFRGGAAALGMGRAGAGVEGGALAAFMKNPRIKAFWEAFKGGKPLPKGPKVRMKNKTPKNPLLPKNASPAQIAAAATKMPKSKYGGRGVPVPKADSYVGKGTPTKAQKLLEKGKKVGKKKGGQTNIKGTKPSLAKVSRMGLTKIRNLVQKMGGKLPEGIPAKGMVRDAQGVKGKLMRAYAAIK